jgi:hypothetical protein
MSYNKPGKGEFGEGPKMHRIRITLSSRHVQALEKGVFSIRDYFSYSSSTGAVKCVE